MGPADKGLLVVIAKSVLLVWNLYVRKRSSQIRGLVLCDLYIAIHTSQFIKD